MKNIDRSPFSGIGESERMKHKRQGFSNRRMMNRIFYKAKTSRLSLRNEERITMIRNSAGAPKRRGLFRVWNMPRRFVSRVVREMKMLTFTFFKQQDDDDAS
ncbi:MAG: type II toxin-antitoxin system YoeB family toxin [Deltaproteobacteria bacterium]|nr:type II toxin-antitoxin system YoeB family toxin [Deltaproteobacteria bacterium]